MRRRRSWCDDDVELERAARAGEEVPEGTASISHGMDRRPVPTPEVRPAGQPPKTERTERRKPYLREQPAPIDLNYRMAYAATARWTARWTGIERKFQ